MGPPGSSSMPGSARARRGSACHRSARCSADTHSRGCTSGGATWTTLASERLPRSSSARIDGARRRRQSAMPWIAFTPCSGGSWPWGRSAALLWGCWCSGTAGALVAAALIASVAGRRRLRGRDARDVPGLGVQRAHLRWIARARTEADRAWRDATDPTDDFRVEPRADRRRNRPRVHSLKTSPLGDDQQSDPAHLGPPAVAARDEVRPEGGTRLQRAHGARHGDITSFASPVENLISSASASSTCRTCSFAEATTPSRSRPRSPGSRTRWSSMVAPRVDGLRIYGLGHPASPRGARGPVNDASSRCLRVRRGSRSRPISMRWRNQPTSSPCTTTGWPSTWRAGSLWWPRATSTRTSNGRVLNGTLSCGSRPRAGAGTSASTFPFTAEVLYFSRGRIRN